MGSVASHTNSGFALSHRISREKQSWSALADDFRTFSVADRTNPDICVRDLLVIAVMAIFQ